MVGAEADDTHAHAHHTHTNSRAIRATFSAHGPRGPPQSSHPDPRGSSQQTRHMRPRCMSARRVVRIRARRWSTMCYINVVYSTELWVRAFSSFYVTTWHDGKRAWDIAQAVKHSL